jgi:signal transduction histidine kinase
MIEPSKPSFAGAAAPLPSAGQDPSLWTDAAARLARVLGGLSLAQRLEHGPLTREQLARWLVALRWLAAFGALATVATAAAATSRLEPGAVPALLGGVAALFVSNLIFSLLGPGRLGAPWALLGQIGLDVLVLGWLVHHAGGMSNPFTGFFVFHAIIAAVVLDGRWAFRATLGICAFVGVQTALEASGLLSPACLRSAAGVCGGEHDGVVLAAAGAAICATAAGCAFIAATLGRVLWADRRRLAATSEAMARHMEAVGASEARLAQERERLQAIVDCMADAVLYVTADGDIGLHNGAARKLWPAAARARLDIRACHPPGEWDRLYPAFAGPEPLAAHPVFEADGRSWEATYARVRDRQGSYQGVVMVARDVTERIQAQRWRMQEERMAVVGKLAAGIAHEINNPLGAIALFTQHALADLPPSHPLADHLGTVLRNTLHCKRIVRDLLQYARQRPPERTAVCIAELLGDVVRTLEPQAGASGVTIRAMPSPWRLHTLQGDSDQLRQVLVNLGLNAIEAMGQGGPLTFEVRPGRQGWLELRVSDGGPGIGADELERIFSAFHTTKPQGTGLGLTVARDLVAAHGGTIEVDSQPGQGSTFKVLLPATAMASHSEPS